MDVQMPELSGLEATERVRAPEEEKGWDAVPIVALTARVMASDREKCVEAGMDDDQSKPIELADSRSVLEEAARGKTSGAAGIEATASDNGGSPNEGWEILDREGVLRRVARDPEFVEIIVDTFGGKPAVFG